MDLMRSSDHGGQLSTGLYAFPNRFVLVALPIVTRVNPLDVVSSLGAFVQKVRERDPQRLALFATRL
jgi:hypothetical protein